MKTGITIDQASKRVLIKMQGLEQLSKKALRSALYSIGYEVKKEAARLITTGKRTGKMYGKHQASAPGEPPANKTGKLANSGRYRVRGYQQMTITEHTPYSGYLEDGTKRMKGARPHLMKAVMNKQADAINIVEDNMRRIFKS